jgi:hypothetical protein
MADEYKDLTHSRLSSIVDCIRNNAQTHSIVGKETNTSNPVRYCTYFTMLPMDDLADCPYRGNVVYVRKGKGIFIRGVPFYSCERRNVEWYNGEN